MHKNFLLLILALSAALMFLGCEGPEGPAGAQGEQGDDAPLYTYMGSPDNACAMCHEDILAGWAGTHHPHAWDDLDVEDQANLYCVQCHVTGFDAEVAYGDTVVTTPGPNLDGWDDYFGVGTEEADDRLAALEGVQCESCHGPLGPDAGSMSAEVNFTTRVIDGEESSMCADCHGQVAEWHESGHGAALEHHEMTIEEYNDEFNAFSTCWECHTGEGFAGRYDMMYSERPETANLIGCQSCHDPHDATNEHQLRSVASQDIIYNAATTATYDDGNSNLCAQCHHARRDNDNVQDQIDNGYAHFGPHGSPQMDMVVGAGSYEIAGYTYVREGPTSHQSLDVSCVDCHMTTIPHGEEGGPKRGHDFAIDLELACGTCHGSYQTKFDDQQAEIEGLLEQLITAIGVDPEDLGDATISTVEQRMAGYAYVFVMNDGSYGVHNPEYAASLLNNAIDFITP